MRRLIENKKFIQLVELSVVLLLLLALLNHKPASEQPIFEKGYGVLTGFVRSDFFDSNGGNK